MILLFSIWIASGLLRWIKWMFLMHKEIDRWDFFIVLPMCFILGPIPLVLEVVGTMR